jgi:2-dehydropantoate 2-reductase
LEKVIVLGAGAIGSYYGALLSKKSDVLLIGRRPHIEAINSEGLVLSGDVEETFKVKATEEVEEVPSGSLILLTTKAYDSEEAISPLKGRLGSDVVIVVLQNGLGNEEIVKSIVGGEAEVVRGLATSGVEFTEPGKIFVRLVGETVLGEGGTGRRIAKLFNECGLKTRLSEDMPFEVWSKLTMNCVINPLSAILRVPDKEIAADSLRGLRRRIVEECVAVGKARGVELDMSILENLERVIPTYENFSSMCQDIMKGKRTEIDFLNGKVVEIGRRQGIPTPVNEVITSLIKFLEVKRWIH